MHRARRGKRRTRVGGGSVVDELIRRAKETGVRIHFVQDTSLLAAMGVVGATLRYSM